MEKAILSQYLVWYFLDVPKEILLGWQNYLFFNFNYFSLSSLLRTYFSPWHKYHFQYPKGFNPAVFFEALVGNMMSRFIGVILRTFVIILGIIAEIFVFFIGAFIFLGWFILPIFLVLFFLTGLRLLV